jgi:hypothetical protein
VFKWGAIVYGCGTALERRETLFWFVSHQVSGRYRRYFVFEGWARCYCARLGGKLLELNTLWGTEGEQMLICVSCRVRTGRRDFGLSLIKLVDAIVVFCV